MKNKIAAAKSQHNPGLKTTNRGDESKKCQEEWKGEQSTERNIRVRLENP